jgi:outer membrane protein
VLKKGLIGAAVAALMIACAPAVANAKDHAQITLGISGVIPQDDAKVSTIGGRTEIANRAVPSLQLEYFFTQNISAELFCCFTRHSVQAVDTALGDFPLTGATLFPPSVTLKYRFRNLGRFEPYIGAGINYTAFFDESTPTTGPVTRVRLEDSFGPSLQVGLDYRLTKHLYARADLRRVWIDSNATIEAGATVIPAQVEINPWIPTFGLGYRF